MSISPQLDPQPAPEPDAQSDPLPEQPAGDDQAVGPERSVAKKSANVVPWPRTQLRSVAAQSGIDILARQQAIVLRILADFSTETTLPDALLATANAIKSSLGAVRVSFGIHDNDAVSLVAVSQQAELDAKTSEADLLCNAMLETVNNDELITTSNEAPGHSELQAHRLLCAGLPDRQVISAPAWFEDQCVAVVCIERNATSAMAKTTLKLVQQTMDALAPLINARRLADRSVGKHARESVSGFFNLTVAPRYVKRKLAIGLALMLLVFSTFFQSTQWVNANAELVPLERRVIAAPRDGYIKSVVAGPGSLVSAGDLLVTMDANELTLEMSRREGELASLSAQLRTAMAEGDRHQMIMLAADIDKAKAQLALAETHLQRSVIKAPVDGLVVSNDLSQMVGAPVSRGQMLLELAPEKGYEVDLLVNEDAIYRIAVGDNARLTLRAMPSEPLELVIDKIHPIGFVDNTRNVFRVTAKVVENGLTLLPGQTGVAKIDTGKTSLLTILTYDFVAWLKLKRWEWLG